MKNHFPDEYGSLALTGQSALRGLAFYIITKAVKKANHFRYIIFRWNKSSSTPLYKSELC